MEDYNLVKRCWSGVRVLYIYSDVSLEAEASPRGSKIAASASPRRFDGSPWSCLGLNVMTSKLVIRYHYSYNFHPFIFFLYMHACI